MRQLPTGVQSPAAQASVRIHPLRHLPPLGRQGFTEYGNLGDARLAHKFAGTDSNATCDLFGGYQRRFVRVSVLSTFQIHNPSQFCAAISADGFPAPCRIVKSADPKHFYTCRVERVLATVSAACDSYRTLAQHSDNFNAPALTFSGIPAPETDLFTDDLVAVWQSLRSEICRLGDEKCNFYSARSAPAFRGIDVRFLAELSHIPGFPEAVPLPPPPGAAGGFGRRRTQNAIAPPQTDGWITVGAPNAPSAAPPLRATPPDINPYRPLEHISAPGADIDPDA